MVFQAALFGNGGNCRMKESTQQQLFPRKHFIIKETKMADLSDKVALDIYFDYL